MKYKALFLDLDGTAVLPFSDVPQPRVVNAVGKIRDRVTVCLATGRLIYQIQSILEVLQINGLCVVANGIQIYDPVTKTVLREIGLSRQDIPQIYATLQKHKIRVRVFDGKNDAPYEKEKRTKILSFFNEAVPTEHVDAVKEDLSVLSDVIVHKLLSREKGCNGLEVCHATATKQHGIFEAAKILGINTHEIIGVGDGYNDFPLLSACGLKIAMGNAVPELKAIADFIAPSVEDDGVAVVIEKFLLTD